MSKFKLWASLALAVVVVGAGLYGWWSLDLRWRPHTIKRHNAEITRILESSGWVSPGKTGPKLYVISYRSCPDCILLEETRFPKLHAANVDTRVIVVPKPDKEGVVRSTAPERATVAELWVNHTQRWPLFEAWTSMHPDAWTAPNVPPADGDTAREAALASGRKMVEDLRPLLKANGVNFAYPLLVWWTKDGEMHSCACEKPESHRRMMKELGAS